MIESLNNKFALQGINFFYGPGNLPFVRIDNEFASAEICLQGAHLTHFKRTNSDPIIWVASECIYKLNTAIRGGIPICWPWFGAHASDNTKPAHGFARNMFWDVKEVSILPSNAHKITFSLPCNEATLQLFPYKFTATLSITIGSQLDLDLTTTNSDSIPFTIGGAFHTYFSVNDISKTTITGLENCSYIDAVDSFKQNIQKDNITFNSEVDRVYQNTSNDIVLSNPPHTITIKRQGSKSAIVWNPWIEKGKSLSGFAPQDYKKMVCIEAANALNDVYILDPGKSHTLSTSIIG